MTVAKRQQVHQTAQKDHKYSSMRKEQSWKQSRICIKQYKETKIIPLILCEKRTKLKAMDNCYRQSSTMLFQMDKTYTSTTKKGFRKTGISCLDHSTACGNCEQWRFFPADFISTMELKMAHFRQAVHRSKKYRLASGTTVSMAKTWFCKQHSTEAKSSQSLIQ